MPLGILVFPRATPDLVRAHVRPGATVIAVDAGADALHAAGVTPDLVVGDMDSVRPDTLEALRAAGVAIEHHPTAKRDTDAALALRRLRDHDEILFLGPGGGRLDHALANLHLLAQASTWARARSIDIDARVWVATPERPLELDLVRGTLVSILPLDAVCEGITYESLDYRLDGARMDVGDPYGVSNVAGAPPQRVSVARGRLFVIVPDQSERAASAAAQS